MMVALALVGVATPVAADDEDGEMPYSRGACYYTLSPIPTLWAESNDMDGLQKRGVYVGGHYVPSDTKDPEPQYCYGTTKD